MPRFPHAAIAQRLLEGDQAATPEEKRAALEDVVVQSFAAYKAPIPLRSPCQPFRHRVHPIEMRGDSMRKVQPHLLQ